MDADDIPLGELKAQIRESHLCLQCLKSDVCPVAAVSWLMVTEFCERFEEAPDEELPDGG